MTTNTNNTSTSKHAKKIARIAEALARDGLIVTHADRTWTVRIDDPDGVDADVLLPDDFPVEGKALRQLAQLAAARHPSGARVERAVATPDFHPGDGGVAIGSVAASKDLVIPAAVGGDINCGMRLHVADVNVETFLAKRGAFVDAMKGDYFFGTRDLPLRFSSLRALFEDGLLGFLEEARAKSAQGALARARFEQIELELERVFGAGSFSGDPRCAPEDLFGAGMNGDDVIRDGGLATIGGGNHFVEVQVVDEVVDRARAWQWGVRAGQLAFMIHSGSRNVGKHVGGAWRDKAKAAWPKAAPFPHGDMFGLSTKDEPELVEAYLRAEATAANYGFLNRMLLAELLRLRLRELFGDGVEAPLVYDLPHNITLREGGAYVVRKGACPAHVEQPVIIPGSMGASSFLLVGKGSARHLCSASHGAGRAHSRFSMEHAHAHGHKAHGHAHGDDDDPLGLRGVDCVTLREERRVQEAPAAYKPIGPVVDVQVEAGIVDVVARLKPVLTFKA